MENSGAIALTAETSRRRIIKLPAVIEMTSLGRSTIYELIKDGDFPRQVLLSERSVGWFEDEIAHWLEKRAALSRHSEPKDQNGLQ